MGVWGYFQYPLEPTSKSDYEREADAMDRDSEEEFIEREMSYADAYGETQEREYEDFMTTWEEITTDEGGWGAWMGGEL